MRNQALTALFTFLLAGIPAALQAQCDADKLAGGTIGEAYECLFENSPTILRLRAQERAEVIDANVATTAPDPFAGRVHSSYQDFFNLLSFAVNQIEESDDGQALIVRFNPLREGKQLLGASLTVAKPGLATELVEAIPAEERPAASAELDKQLEDTDDLTWALSYSLQSEPCDAEKLGRSWCWGRSPKIYRQALSQVMIALTDRNALLSDDGSQELFTAIAGAAPQGFKGDVFTLRLDQLSRDIQAQVLDSLSAAANRNARQTADLQKYFTATGIGQIATLIDNQPQFALTGTMRERGRLGGADEEALTLEVQVGRINVNSVFQDCEGNAACVAERLRGFQESNGATLATDKFVLSASYKRRDRYNLTSTQLNLPADLVTFAGLDLPNNNELKVRLQWGRQIKGNLGGLSRLFDNSPENAEVTPKNARWDLSLNGIRNSSGSVLTENRWVATWTLTMPFGEQMSLPFTVTYANKPEFLGEQRRRYSAHLGITYRLPWEGPQN
ncbi:MAG: hypothetical protein QOH06_5055 [Acidobacteriota bacterium]|jgi:hypothetical protein|nr:hypothetical protein [Acidobacteriota bacterium]